MRALADTLPVLRDDAGEQNAQAPGQSLPAFDPEQIAKALNARRAGASDHGSSAQNLGLDTSGPRATVRDVRTTLKRIHDPSINTPKQSTASPATIPARDGEPQPTRSAASAIPAQSDDAGPSAQIGATDEVDHVKRAVEAALANAAREHEEALAAALAEAEAQATARLVETRARWVREEAERLGARFEEQLADLAMEFNDQVGRVLEPVVTAAVRERAVERFATLLTRLSSESASPFLTVTGPQDLLDNLAEHLAGFGTVNLQVADTADLSVHIADTELATTLADWVAEIELSEASQ